MLFVLVKYHLNVKGGGMLQSAWAYAEFQGRNKNLLSHKSY